MPTVRGVAGHLVNAATPEEEAVSNIRELPADYDERVYAGVLGKIIGVYLGRPFEGWTYDRILRDLGEITGYVNDRTDLPLNNHLLVVTDDDISGTLVFPRVLDDVPTEGSLDPRAVARTWLNELIPERTVLWWGGLGNSTEHTAYLRLRAGVEAPLSGSAELNGRVVSEQVGAQIFCEGFAMTCPADPARAADLAQAAASVSHDGEALQAARMVAGHGRGGVRRPRCRDACSTKGSARSHPGCLIADVIRDVRAWSADGDWHATRAQDRRALRLQPVRRQLPRRPEPRRGDRRDRPQRRRLRPRHDGGQHLRLGHRLQRRRRGFGDGRLRRPGRSDARCRLPRTTRGSSLPADGRAGRRDHGCGPGGVASQRARADPLRIGADGAQGRRPVPLHLPRIRSGLQDLGRRW